MIEVIILAGGKGKRMSQTLPKVMHKISDMTMIDHVILSAKGIDPDKIILIHSQTLEEHFKDIKYINSCTKVLQKEPLGTGNAVLSALTDLDPNKIHIVLLGDAPGIPSESLKEVASILKNSDIAILARYQNTPDALGRVLVDDKSNFIRILEHKEASEEEKKNKLCNTGILGFRPLILHKYLPTLKKNSILDEFLLTDLPAICKNDGLKISVLIEKDDKRFTANTQEELFLLQKEMDNFNIIADKFLESIAYRLESEDIEGKIEIEYFNGNISIKTKFGHYMINKNESKKEIWLSSPISGPKHFSYKNFRWVNYLNEDLEDLLNLEFSNTKFRVC